MSNRLSVFWFSVAVCSVGAILFLTVSIDSTNHIQLWPLVFGIYTYGLVFVQCLWSSSILSFWKSCLSKTNVTMNKLPSMSGVAYVLLGMIATVPINATVLIITWIFFVSGFFKAVRLLFGKM